MKTSDLAPSALSAALGRRFANRTAMEDVHAWCFDGERPRLFDFEPKPGKPGVPLFDAETEDGAGGFAVLRAVEKTVGRWVAQNVQAGEKITSAHIAEMIPALASGTWVCNPDLPEGDPRLAILEASGC